MIAEEKWNRTTTSSTLSAGAPKAHFKRWLQIMKHRKGIIATSLLSTALVGLAWYWVVGYDNYHVVVQGELYRSAQLSSTELLNYIERDGVATVINLRHDVNGTWWSKEKVVCGREGVMHIDVPLMGGRAPTMEEMKNLVSVMHKSRRPLLVHCKHGADRTSLAIALYLLEEGNAEAVPTSAFSARYGHLPILFPSMQCFDNAYTQYRLEKSQQNPARDGLKPRP